MHIRNIILIIFILFIIDAFFITESSELKANKNKINYREEMRSLVIRISSLAKKIKPDFIVVPQNAMDLAVYNGKPDGGIAEKYMSSIDGTGCEELFYGHEGDGNRTAADTTKYFLNYLLMFKNQKKAILVIDYVTNKKQADDSFTLCQKYGFISFPGTRSLTKIPNWIFNNNKNEVANIMDAKNFLYLLNASTFRTPDTYISALKKAENDLIVIDAFFWGKVLSRDQVGLIQKKPSGKKRLVLAYLSIGEAEDYRYYWRPEWKKNFPGFLERENPEWKGNYKVKYWTKEWQEIICGLEDGSGFENSYLKKIMNAGFDGVYLDVLDAAYYFEKK
jgi:cysteinyl-tRNA synthetase, unknown class